MENQPINQQSTYPNTPLQSQPDRNLPASNYWKTVSIVLFVLIVILLTGIIYIFNSKGQEKKSNLSPSSTPTLTGYCTDDKTCQQPNAGMIKTATNQIIIKYKASADLTGERAPSHPVRLKELSTAAGIPLEYLREMSGGAHVLRLPNRLPESEVRRITEQLMALSDVEYAEPDSIMQLNDDINTILNSRCINNRCVRCMDGISCSVGYHGCGADAYDCQLTCCPDATPTGKPTPSPQKKQ